MLSIVTIDDNYHQNSQLFMIFKIVTLVTNVFYQNWSQLPKLVKILTIDKRLSHLFAIVYNCTVTITLCHNCYQLSQYFRIATIGHHFHYLSKLRQLNRFFKIGHN